MFAWLKLWDPRVWFAVALVVAVAAYTGAVYHAGGVGPRAELHALEDSVAHAQAAHVKEDQRRESLHLKLTKGLDDERVKAIDTARAGWAAYNRVRKSEGRTGGAAQSVQVTAGRCDNEAGNAAVSAAVSVYRNAVVGAVGRFRDGVAGIIETCQLQADALVRLQEWAAEEQRINQ